MKTIAKIGLGLLTFGFVIAVLGAIVIRTSAPRPAAKMEASASPIVQQQASSDTSASQTSATSLPASSVRPVPAATQKTAASKP